MTTQGYDDGPEVALQHYPEAIPPLPSQAYAGQPPPLSSTSLSPGKVDANYISILPSVAQYQQNPHFYDPVASQDGTGDGALKDGQRRGPFGCTLPIFWLSAIIAVLSLTVVGLAAGTGVEANRANNAERSLARLSSSASTTTTVCAASSASAPASASPTPTSFASLDMGCSNLPDTVTGTRYTSYQLLGQQTFTIHCNKDAGGDALLSLFVADMESCIDACSGYTKYTTSTFDESNSNTTCGAVSFVPLWTDKVNATAGGAPGNCYLKPTTDDSSKLPNPNIGTECHAATLDDS